MHEILANRHYVHRPACKMVNVLRFKGMPNIDRFKEAIRLAMSRHEILNTKVSINKDGQAFYEKIEEPLVKIDYQAYEAVEAEDLSEVETMLDIALDWVKDEDEIPLEINKGEYMHHGIFTDTKETVWAISSHYLAGDAQSIQYLIRDVLFIYENEIESIESIPLKPLDIDLKQAFNDELNFLQRRQVNKLNKAWAKTNKSFSFEEYEYLYKRFHKHYSLSTLTMSLDEETSKSLIAKASAKDYHLNAVIAAAYNQVTEENETFTFPLSTRSKGYEGMGIYGGSVNVIPKRLSTNPDRLEDNIIKINEQLDKNMQDTSRLERSNIIVANLNGNLIDSGYYAAFAEYKNQSSKEMQKLFSLHKTGSGMQINNLGLLDYPQEYSFGELEEVYYIPSIIPNFRRAISYNTFAGKLFFTSSYYQKDNVELLFLSRFKDQLTEFVN